MENGIIFFVTANKLIVFLLRKLITFLKMEKTTSSYREKEPTCRCYKDNERGETEAQVSFQLFWEQNITLLINQYLFFFF